MKTKSALSYFGSDSEVAGQLAGLLDHCKHVTIPFVGGAAILPHLKARGIVANDLNWHALNFYRVMSSKLCRQELIDMCQTTLSHPGELDLANKILAEPHVSSTHVSSTHVASTHVAWAYWALCWIGRKGKGGTKHMVGMPSVRRTANGGNNATRIRAAANDLQEWATHFERCEWESVDFRSLLAKVADRPDCGIYCDPPWIGAGRNYLHTFSEQDHRDLCDQLGLFLSATIVVRYGDDPLLREIYTEPEWTWIETESRTQANKVRGEVWIVKNEVKTEESDD